MLSFKRDWPIHLLGWLLFVSLPVTIIARDPDPDIQARLLTSLYFWAFVLVYCVFFYANLLYWMPALFLRQRYVLYAGVFAVCLLAIYFFKPFEKLLFSKFRQEPTMQRPMPDRQPPPAPGMDVGRPPAPMRTRQVPAVDFVSLVLFIMIWVIAMAIRIAEQWRLSEKRALLSETDKAQAELSFFKAQINPHFLFNTLNNIYAMAVSKSEHTAPSILKLSAMMRYITEEATENFVPLRDEIACLENYIALQKLRLTDKTQVSADLRTAVPDLPIAPLVLMTFVENAFKYGVSNHHASEIRITLSAAGKELLFFCENRIFMQGQIPGREGLGIANTQKRLGLLYPDRHALHIENDGTVFRVHLKLMIP